jgi:hypothetical protein
MQHLTYFTFINQNRIRRNTWNAKDEALLRTVL